jgi:hypothetical protein
VGDPKAEEQLQLVQSGSGGTQSAKLAAKAASPTWEIGSGHRQRLYCPIDTCANLFFMTPSKSAPNLPREYHRLRRKLSNIGWIALGSLLERNQPGQGGPRYQWSRRIGPKTVTVALSAQQFNWLKHAISNQREVWDILMRLQQLTALHALQHVPGPPRRKRLSNKRLGIN